MRYGPNLLDEILRRTDIVQLVGRKVKLTRRGQAFWGCGSLQSSTSCQAIASSRRTRPVSAKGSRRPFLRSVGWRCLHKS
jgi:hypothetical protein